MKTPLIILFSLATHDPRMISVLDYNYQLYEQAYRPRAGEARLRLSMDKSLFFSDGLPNLAKFRTVIDGVKIDSSACQIGVDLP